MSVSRYDLRKQVLLDEANAIGTTYLRAEFLPEPFRNEVKERLRRYSDARLEFFAAGEDLAGARRAEADVQRLQGELWARATAVTRADTHAVGLLHRRARDEAVQRRLAIAPDALL